MNLANHPLAGEVTNSSCSNTTNGLITLENDYRQLKLRKVVYTIEMIDDNDNQGDIGTES